MADNDRVVYPDEVEETKKAASQVNNEAGDSNSVEETADTTVTPPVAIANRNMIQVPPNCPDGYKMGADGICREVFD